jgi:serine/threonine protein kinase
MQNSVIKTYDFTKNSNNEGFSIGQNINSKYIIEKNLGQGGMGLTYLAYDAGNFNRKVVIKTILRNFATPDGINSFLKEGEALGRINDDRVVKLFDKGNEDKTNLPYLVMEYVDGISLDRYLQKEKLSILKTVSITKQIAAALTKAHQEQVLHRDLKPSNIMIVEDKLDDTKIKLIDFGVAKVSNTVSGIDTTHLGFKGTLQYASPEQLNGFQTISGETYNVAMLTYLMMTGKHPFPITVQPQQNESQDSFNGRAFSQIKTLQAQGAVKPNKINAKIPEKTSNVILKGLAYDQTKRYKNPLDFATALGNSVKGFNFNPRKLVAILMLLLILAIVFFGLKYLKNNETPSDSQNNISSGNFVENKHSNTNNLGGKENLVVQTPVFTYSFDVQKMKDNKLTGEHFTTPDKAKISFGDKFNLKISRETDGKFYLIEQIGEKYNLIFPNSNQDTKEISLWRVSKPDQSYWLIWSKTKVDELESNKPSLFQQFLQKSEKIIDLKEVSGKIQVHSNKDLAILQLPL